MAAVFAVSSAAHSQQNPTPPTVEAVLPDAPQAATAVTLPENDAQSSTLRGLVTDRDGAVYQGVQITLAQSAGTSFSLKTDSDGRFLFERLQAGKYQLVVSAEGFATQTLPVELRPGQTVELPAITLLVTRATTDVQVTASVQEIAQAQLKQEEQQRIFGAIPNFYVVYSPNPAPLTPKQKFHLAWRYSIDPVTFAFAGFFAGIEQANNSFAGYGQGAQGYAKRFGANYADGFIGSMIGSALFPSILKQDPRYFYKGTGTVRARILYALGTSVLAKGDKGRWQPNYSGFLGGAAAGGISNLYYPAKDRNGASLIFETELLGIANGAAQNLLQEFLVRKITPKLPKTAPPSP